MYSADIRERKLLFLLKSFYSIRLYDYYEEWIGKQSDRKENNSNSGSSENQDSEILKPDYIEGVDYMKLAAGRFFNPTLTQVIPRKGSSIGKFRSHHIIKRLDYLHSLISECIKDLGENKIDGNKIRTVELMMLCISRSVDTKNNQDGSDYRKTMRRPFYSEPLEDKSQNAYFDVSSIFYNILDMEKCYERFKSGKVSYELLNEKKEVDSFLSQSQSKSENKESVIKKSVYDGPAIRNVEVLQGLLEYIIRKRYNSPSNSSIADFLREFFEKVHSYAIRTYDTKEITFSFYNIIADWLRRLGKDERLRIDSLMAFYIKIWTPEEILKGRTDSKNIRKSWLVDKFDKVYKDDMTDEMKDVFNRLLSRYQNASLPYNEVKSIINQFNKEIFGEPEEN